MPSPEEVIASVPAGPAPVEEYEDHCCQCQHQLHLIDRHGGGGILDKQVALVIRRNVLDIDCTVFVDLEFRETRNRPLFHLSLPRFWRRDDFQCKTQRA